jgi:lipopolysaccharide cholinephosphotransferase
MKEYERIISEGVLPDSFFKEETLCDFLVDTSRKKLWAISLDLLFKFDDICRKHHLRYSLAYGSLLGVIRHSGFIPWDDDIDVFLPREDYEVLKTLKDEFNRPYYLQIPGDDGYCYSFIRLRNSNTTGLAYAFRYEHFNQGIPLDIFVLDNYNPDTIEEDYKQVQSLIRECSTFMRRNCPHPDEKDLQYLAQYPIRRECSELVAELDAALKKNEDIVTDKCICLCNVVYGLNHAIFDKSLYQNRKEIDLYGHPVFIPEDYNTVLTTIYGDYMTPPPIEKRGSWHQGATYDPDRPYTEYVKELWDKEKE